MTIRDGDWTLQEYDHFTGRSVWSYFDGVRMHIRTDYPVAETVKANREAFNSAPSGFKGEWHHVASIPANVHYGSGLHDAIRQQDRKWTKRWLNDSDNRAWRVKDGAV